MSKFKKLYLPLFISVAMLSMVDMHASTAAGNDPRDGTCATSFSSSSSTASVKVPVCLKDEQISAMTDAQINALVTKISPFQMAGHLTEEEQALAKAAQASGQGKEYAPLKEHQLRMISTYVDQILADRGSEPAEFAASAQSIKDFIQKLCYAQYKMFSSIVRRYIRAVKVDLIKAFSQAEAISDKYARLAAKESARKYFNTRIGGLFWATHEERNSMERTMGRANFKDALEALFAHSNFASIFGNQLDVILKEANTLLKTCNVSSVSDTGIQELLQITHMDMLNTLPKDLMLQYDVLVAKNANEWDLHIASLGDSALHDKSSNPFFRRSNNN